MYCIISYRSDSNGCCFLLRTLCFMPAPGGRVCASWRQLLLSRGRRQTSWARRLQSRRRFSDPMRARRLSAPSARHIKSSAKKRRKVIFVLALVADLGILAALKYTNFLITNVNALFSADIAAVDWVLPPRYIVLHLPDRQLCDRRLLGKRSSRKRIFCALRCSPHSFRCSFRAPFRASAT